MTKPFLPSDLKTVDPLVNWRRHALALALAAETGMTLPMAIERYWSGERGAVEAITRAAVSPLSLGGAGAPLAGTALAAFLRSLAPQSAAARLFEVAQRIGLAGASTIGLPRRAARFPDPTFVAEGAPIPAMQGGFASVPLGPARKLAMLAGLTAELQSYSTEGAEGIISAAMNEAAAHALDGAVFSTAAASDVRPAGLLFGVTALPAAPLDNTAGSKRDAMAEDLAALAGAIGDAGAGTQIMIFCHPRQAMALAVLAGANPNLEIVPTAAIAAGTVIAVDAAAIASGFSGLPELDVSQEATIHYEDAAPQPISTPGSPNVAAAPVRSAYQTSTLVLRMILRCAWMSRLPGAVQYVTGVAW